MTAFWLNAQSERLVAACLADPRPAWVWAVDGEKRVWRNRAARAYEAAHRRADGDELVPVPRQVPRAIRLGVPLRSSRARLQFTLGRKPVSETCLCTPLFLSGNAAALLAVMSEPVSDEQLAAIATDADSVAPFIGGASHYVLTASDGSVLMSGGAGPARLAAGQDPTAELPAGAAESRLILFPDAEPGGQPTDIEPETAADAPAPDDRPADAPAAEDAATPDIVPEDVQAETEPPVLSEETTSDDDAAEPEPQPQPETTAGGDDAAAAADGDAQAVEAGDAAETADAGTAMQAEDEKEAESDGLLSLLDRLASRKILFEPVDERDDEPFLPPQPVAEVSASTQEPDAEPETDAEPEPDSGSESSLVPDAEPATGIVEDEADLAEEPAEPEATESAETPPAEDALDAAEAASVPVRLWRVIGRNLLRQPEPSDATAADDADAAGPEPAGSEEAPAEDAPAAGTGALSTDTAASGDEQPDDDDQMARTSRYNFDELSRILIDRVFSDDSAPEDEPEAAAAPVAGSLVNLGDENLILNRLPIGLLVFRDQEVLFSNRALSDLLGYVDGSSLRKAGLAGVFPPEGDSQAAGPVTRLMGADGRIINVSARLQTISWQGRPALLLSASRQKEPPNAEDLTRSFAEIVANALECGYFETSRAGIITSVSGRAALLSRRKPDNLIGRPIAGLIALDQGPRLRGFLEQPARFAGSQRPMMRFEGTEADTEIVLFAEGMAGIVTGYFGLLRVTGDAKASDAPPRGIDPHFLIRLSRAVRQPVNAIVGFADMIRTKAFGPVGNERYTDYAGFIRSAGQDIASVVDELENYAKLREGDYPLDTTRIGLIDLLEQCVTRVRPFANTARVLLRSAISTSLPDVSADEATLTQAVLNVLASAVAHSPNGGQVVLSAQRRGDGAIEVHIRDSGPANDADMDDSFMVFRDGISRDGEQLAPVPSAIGLALTRSLLAVNACSLELGPGPGAGSIFSLVIPAEIVAKADTAQK